MTVDTVAAAQKLGFWRRLWSLLQAAEMSSAEYQDLRIVALERRVAELQKELRVRASPVSDTLEAQAQENS